MAPRWSAVGFFVGVYRSALGTDGEHIDLPDRFAYACSETAPPTAEAIGDLVREALEDARYQTGEQQSWRGDDCRGWPFHRQR